MHAKRIILCGGLPVPATAKIEEPIRLNLQPDAHDHERVALRISDLHQPIQRNIPPVFQDLVELAAYVYSADQAVRRSYQDTDTFGAPWRQHLHFHVPVRCPDIWRRADVLEALTSVLEFLGDHFFSFEFSKATAPVPFQQYLDFPSVAPRTPQYDQVVMFSGGLDSLAGAIDEITQERHRVAFVTHIPTPKKRGIIRRLRTELDNLAKPVVPLHVGVEVNKAKSLGKEYTQRTRSFLFASLGATVAQMLGLSSLRFYENGVVSLNLPLCGQAVGGRASRTTHPRVLAGFSQLFSLLNDSKIEVTNPYLWLTKAQIIKRIIDAGHGDLVAQSISCAHTWERSNQQTHCGKCSQCLDRRLAMLAAGAFDRDPAEQYKFNIFTEAPSALDDKILVASYIERARTLQEIKSVEVFIARYPELVRALAFADGLSHQQTAQKFLDLHQRHGREVGDALETITRRHIPDFINHRLPEACLLRIVIDPKTSVQLVAPPAHPNPSHQNRSTFCAALAKFGRSASAAVSGPFLAKATRAVSICTT